MISSKSISEILEHGTSDEVENQISKIESKKSEDKLKNKVQKNVLDRLYARLGVLSD